MERNCNEKGGRRSCASSPAVTDMVIGQISGYTCGLVGGSFACFSQHENVGDQSSAPRQLAHAVYLRLPLPLFSCHGQILSVQPAVRMSFMS